MNARHHNGGGEKEGRVLEQVADVACSAARYRYAMNADLSLSLKTLLTRPADTDDLHFVTCLCESAHLAPHARIKGVVTLPDQTDTGSHGWRGHFDDVSVNERKFSSG